MTGRMWERGPDGQIRKRPDPGRETRDARRGTALPRALALGFRGAYDTLGSTLLLSLVWCLVVGLATVGGWALGLALQGPRGQELAAWLLDGTRAVSPGSRPGDPARFVAGAVVPFALWVFAAAPLTAGIYAFVRDVAAHEHPVWSDVLPLARLHFRPAARLGALQALVTLVLLTDFLFFASRATLGLKLAGLLFLYPLLFWLLAAQYQWPLLVEQRQGARSAVKKSLLLALDNLLFTLGLGLVGAVLGIACVISMIGFPLLLAGTLAFLHTEATRALLRKYDVLPPEPEPQDEGWGREIS